MAKSEEDKLQNILTRMNKVLSSYIKYKGTRTYYIKGVVGNKRICYTKAKTGYNGKLGFWSWIETSYKNKKIKRTKFAKSANKRKCEQRVIKLLINLKLLKEGFVENE